MSFIHFFLVYRRTAYHKQLPVDTKSPQAAAILVSVQKKTKIFGCNLSEYLKVCLPFVSFFT